ncbi:MAG: cupin domain-containing protein [Candidatus Desulfofervidus auxilii]|nr:cupin domain-containing protein [Candidatus Desulfofervidus auxilii]
MEIKKEKPTEERLKSLGVDNWSPWECEPSSFDWEYFEDERCYILDGKAIIETPDGKKVEIAKGDLVLFPKGLKCRWQVIEKIRKVYRFE